MINIWHKYYKDENYHSASCVKHNKIICCECHDAYKNDLRLSRSPCKEESRDSIICPYCKFEYTDDVRPYEAEEEMQCEKCEKNFTYHCEVTYNYISRPIKL